MSQLVHTPHQSPAWATRASTQIEGVALVSRQLVVAGMYVGAFVLMVWFVAGLIIGFVSLQALITGLLGAGGIGTAGELLRRFWGKDDDGDDQGAEEVT